MIWHIIPQHVFANKYQGSYKDVYGRICLLENDSNPKVRLSAAFALRLLNDFSVLPNLYQTLKKESHALTRRELIIAIGDIFASQKKNSSLEELEKQLQGISLDKIAKELAAKLQRDGHYFVRRVCAEALGKIGYKNIIPDLLVGLAGDSNKFVRKAIAQTLGKIGDKKVIGALQQAKRSRFKVVADAAKEAITAIYTRTL